MSTPKNPQEWHEVVADLAADQLRLRKKCSKYDREITQLEGIIAGMTRERKRLVEKILGLGGSV